MFNMEDPGIQSDFIAFAEDLYTENSDIRKRQHGDQTVCVFWWVENKTAVTCGSFHVDDLKEAIRDAVKREVAAHT